MSDDKPTEIERVSAAVARVTPCSCSAQRSRAEAAERMALRLLSELEGVRAGREEAIREARMSREATEKAVRRLSTAKAGALREAADEWEALVQREKPPIRGSLWLRARADQIEAP